MIMHPGVDTFLRQQEDPARWRGPSLRALMLQSWNRLLEWLGEAARLEMGDTGDAEGDIARSRSRRPASCARRRPQRARVEDRAWAVAQEVVGGRTREADGHPVLSDRATVSFGEARARRSQASRRCRHAPPLSPDELITWVVSTSMAAVNS